MRVCCNYYKMTKLYVNTTCEYAVCKNVNVVLLIPFCKFQLSKGMCSANVKNVIYYGTLGVSVYKKVNIISLTHNQKMLIRIWKQIRSKKVKMKRNKYLNNKKVTVQYNIESLRLLIRYKLWSKIGKPQSSSFVSLRAFLNFGLMATKVRDMKFNQWLCCCLCLWCTTSWQGLTSFNLYPKCIIVSWIMSNMSAAHECNESQWGHRYWLALYNKLRYKDIESSYPYNLI